MSKKNARNKIRKEYFKNYTTKIKVRNIIVEKGTKITPTTRSILKTANSDTNILIQKLNILVETRQIPYISLKIINNSCPDSRTRIMLHNVDTTASFLENFKNKLIENSDHVEMSHIVDILIALGCNDLKNSELRSDLGMVMDPNITVDSIVDILLDIAMFNSYSFLKNLSAYEKRLFNIHKVEYIRNNLRFSYYSLDTSAPFYLSFAFAARDQNGRFDVDKYISLWNNFISYAYPGSTHVEKTVIEQLRQHVDYGNLPKNTVKLFRTKPDGCYLLLRKNKVRSKDLEDDIKRLFKRKKSIIIPICEFNSHERFFKKLDVSVYKVIKKT